MAAPTLFPPFAAADPGSTLRQQRERAFCAADGRDVFHSITHHHEVWRPDPLDVETIHESARDAFQRLLNRATTPPGLPFGRLLLLLGESGSGKTHLMRAFRNHVHARGLGYCGYLQMTTGAHDYARYVLHNLIAALDQPYYHPEIQASGLMMLSHAVLEALPETTPEERTRLREAELDSPALSQLVNDLADRAMGGDPRFQAIELDLLRALIYLQRNDQRITSRILKYLRCENLAAHDCERLGGLVPLTADGAPLRMLEQLGRLMWAVQSMALVLCLDQIEDMYNLADAPDHFRRAVGAIIAIGDRVPSSVLVIACLEDYYTKLREHLTQAKRDRVEHEPPPVRLTSQRSAEEVRALIARRVEYLYDQAEVPVDDQDVTFPFVPEVLDKLTNLRTRDVLGYCHTYREACIHAGRLLPFEGVEVTKEGPTPPPDTTIEQLWNDYLAGYKAELPDGEPGRAAILRWAVKACTAEIPAGYEFDAEADGRFVPVELHGPDNAVERLLVGVCEKDARGTGLQNQIKELEHRAGEHRPVIVRSTDFPKGPKAKVNEQIGQLITRGGRRTVVSDTDWRTMLALRAFRSQPNPPAGLNRWLREERPLTRLPSLRHILDLDHLPTAAAAPSAAAAPAPPTPSPAAPAPASPLPVTPPADVGALRLGLSRDLSKAPVTLPADVLTRHAAFLGGSGSGKTTLALHLIEQLLLRGVPAVLLDRKGDLCGYADPSFWTSPAAGPEVAARRERLRSVLDVAVYTPGHPAGRPLAIPVVPDGLDQMEPHEREQFAGYAAAALAGMMKYKETSQRDKGCRAILHQAISLLGGQPVTVPLLIEAIDGQDPALLAAVGVLDTKLFKKLAQDLQTLWLNFRPLLDARGERLDARVLFGRGPHAKPGRTRLSIVSTKFLGGLANTEFWVAQFLLELARWSSKYPSKQLQAVVLFDEADVYLPAQGQPATKAPMEGLLKRARSAGLGVFLASQSPGDFDYKCRDNVRSWFVGRVTQTTAIDKMKPLLNEAKGDVSGKLANQQPGEFFLLGEGVSPVPLKAERSLLATEQMAEEEIVKLSRAAAE